MRTNGYIRGLSELMKYFLFYICLFALLFSCKKSDSITEIPSPADQGAEQPYLYEAPDGLYMTWQLSTDSLNKLKYSKYSNGSWSEPSILAKGYNWFINWADFPSVSVNESGSILSHFLPKSGESTFAYDIHLVLNKPDTAFKLHDDTVKGEHGFVSSIPYGNNKFFVTWLDGRNAGTNGGHHMGAMSLRAAVITASGVKEHDWLIDEKVCDCCQTSVAMTSKGPIVAYRDRSGEELRDISYRRYVNNTWTPIKKIADDNWKITGCPVNGPKVAASGDKVVIAWYTGEKNEPKVKFAVSGDNGESFSDPVIVSKSTLGRLDLEFAPDNNAIWISHLGLENGDAVLSALKYDIKGNLLDQQNIVSLDGARKTGFPQMEAFEENLYFAWTNSGDTATIELRQLSLN